MERDRKQEGNEIWKVTTFRFNDTQATERE